MPHRLRLRENDHAKQLLLPELCTSIVNIIRHDKEKFRRQMERWKKATHMLLTFLTREKLTVLWDIAMVISAEYGP